MFFSKKSQGQVIGVLLIILMTVGAIVLISTFATKFVKDKLSETDCVDVENKIAITNNPKYTCYDEISGQMRVQIHVGALDKIIEGFTISIQGASSDSFKIVNNTVVTGVTMFYPNSVPFEGVILIPSTNSEKTYNISVTEKPDSVSVYPILEGGQLCGASDTYAFIDYCE